MPWRSVAAAIYFCLLFRVHAAEERIWIDAKLNGAPAKIFLDTGAPEFYLFRPAAERIGLRLPEVHDESPWRMYFAKDKCDIELPGMHRRVMPVVVEPPGFIPAIEADGFVGWKMIRKNVVQFDAARQRLVFLPESVGELPGWMRLKVRSNKPSGVRNWGILALQLPDDRIVIIDTGQDAGVGLPTEQWRAWKIAHPRAPIRRVKLTTPSVGVVELERSQAVELQVGPIHLTNVSVQETEPWSRGMAKERHAATFGMDALKRLDLIVDGKRELAFLRSKP